MKNERLYAWLRAGDPASEGSPGPVEIARMRSAILAEAATRSMRPRPLRALVAATALAAGAGLAVAAWLARSGPAAVLPPVLDAASVTWAPREPPPLAAERAVPPAREPRSRPQVTSVTQATTVRFTTRRGTQIIWTLDPRVEL